MANSEIEIYGRLSALSTLTAFALALAARDHDNPAERLDIVLRAVMGVLDNMEEKLPPTIPLESMEECRNAFNEQVETVRDFAIGMLKSMGAEDTNL